MSLSTIVVALKVQLLRCVRLVSHPAPDRARMRHDGNVIVMSPRFRRVFSVGIAVAVAVLVLVCVALVHHEGAAADRHEAAHLAPAGVTTGGHGSTAPDHASGDRCSMVELVACARTSTSSLVGLVLLIVGAMMAAMAVAIGVRPVVCRASLRRTGFAPPSFMTAPSLSALCISRT